MASCLLLAVILVGYLWSFWRTSEVAWTLPLFVLQAASAIALALSAQFIKVDLLSAETPTAQYFDNCRATFGLWASAPIFALLFSLSTNGAEAIDAARIGVAVLLVSMGYVRKPMYHTVVLGALLFIVVIVAPAVGGLAIEL